MQTANPHSMESYGSSSNTIDTSDESSFFKQVDAYPYSTDSDFQNGLAAILGATDEAGSREHLTLRAKCFFFAR